MRIAILGCGGHARSVANIMLINEVNSDIDFFDSEAKHNEVLLSRYNVYNYRDFDINLYDVFFVAIGNNTKRRGIMENEASAREKLVSVISKHSFVGTGTYIGKGVFVSNNVHIGPEARISDGCIINTGSIVEHEVVIERYSHISVNSTVCGRCFIGENVMVGAGATIIDGISICDNVIIGAGAVVVSDITEAGTYIGVPAKRVRDVKN